MTHTVETKLWCEDCGAFIGKHRSIVSGDVSAYGGLEAAPGMIPIGKRSFGFPDRLRTRSGAALVVTTPGPVTLRCRCHVARKVDVPV